MALRSLRSLSSSPLFSTDSFVFDGTNSDIARQLYIRHTAGDVEDKIALTVIPTIVKNRLDCYNIVFNDLPGLVQRAVLWDSGFAISPSHGPVQVWPLMNYTMADIAVPRDNLTEEVKAAMVTPSGSDWVTKWLEKDFVVQSEYQTSSHTQQTAPVYNLDVGTIPIGSKRPTTSSLQITHQSSLFSSGDFESAGSNTTLKILLDSLIEFITVAWNSLNTLSMVLECSLRGNLQTYLHQNADLLSWARDKIYMAIAMAQALQCLHSRLPAVIHRDLKSNNVLLMENLELKLIDFGVSRGLADVTMTAGIGTPYWTAPEILEGKRYTEQADIYSFGVVLSELDTGKIPYYNAGLFRFCKKSWLVHYDQVFRARIQRVGPACLSFDPFSRPTAYQPIHELEGNTAELEFVF